MIKRIKVSLYLNRRNVLSKIELGRHVETSMTANANFADAGTLVSDMATSTNALETANGLAISGGPLQTLQKRKAIDAFDAAMEKVRLYVEGVANSKSDESIVLSAGLSLRKTSGRRPLLANLIVASSFLQHEILLRAGRTKGARIYRWEVFFVANSGLDSPGPQKESDWTLLAETSKANFHATGLQSGTRYWFRMVVISRNGRGAYSVVINQVCM